VTTDLLDQARTGDPDAFRDLVEPYQRDLGLHCYRILGSAHDAEDALQETMLAAWQGLAGFEGRSSVRTWLYRIATSRSLNAVRSRSRRPTVEQPLPPGLGLPEPSRRGEVPWLEPYPDLLLAGIADTAPGPDARYEAREAISLAFVVALQLLPARQRAVLILRDVLGFHAGEVAQILDTTDESVTSALKRARATMQRQAPPPGGGERAPEPRSEAERELVERLTQAFEASDVDGIVALLTEDVQMAMPPIPFEWLGRELGARFLRAIVVPEVRLVATRANGQPAFALYVQGPEGDGLQTMGLLVVTLAGARVSAITRFKEGVLERFGLPHNLTA
jgi:RNA polymerase sigma-70 factor (ECF subfamily)